MSSALCPLCSTNVPLPSLETHLRVELRYPSVHCLLCPLRFYDRQEAEEHFRGRFAEHPDEEVQIAQKRDRDKERRLADLIDQALGKRQQNSEGKELRPRLVTLKQGDESVLRESTHTGEKPEEVQQMCGEWTGAAFKPTNEGASELADAPEQSPVAADAPGPVAAGVEAVSDESLDLVDTSLEEIPSSNSASKGQPLSKCKLCSQLVPANGFQKKQHAALHHLKQPIFSCNLCSYASFGVKIFYIRQHIQKNHPEHSNVNETPWTTLLIENKDKIAEMTQKCFPGTQVNWVPERRQAKPRQRTVHCAICGKTISDHSQSAIQHATRQHWKSALHSCKLCPSYKSRSYRKSDIKTHLKTKHNALPSPATIHSAVEEHRDAIAQLVDQCFPPI